jgi:hypothetical protein
MKTITSEWFEFFPGDMPCSYAPHLNNHNSDTFGPYDADRLRFLSINAEKRDCGGKAKWFGEVVFEVVPDHLIEVYSRIFEGSPFGIVFIFGDAILRDAEGKWIEPVDDETEVFVMEKLVDP